MKRLFFLLSLCSILSLCLGTQSNWPKYFSTQDKINPQTIKSDYQASATTAIFNNQFIPIPPQSFLQTSILGVGDSQTTTDKRIEVDLTKQRVYAFENGQKIYDFITSTGTWGRTPTGTFKIWTKIRSQKMSGGSRALGTYYYLPNVPYILYYYNKHFSKSVGYSLHGTYWHNNFGVPMSHGCVNMRTPDIAKIFTWVDLNTPVVVYGKYQTSLPRTYRP